MVQNHRGKSNKIILFFSIFLVGIGFSIIMPILPYYAESMGANAFQLGLLLTVYALCQFIFAPYWGAYSDKVGRKPVLLLGIIGFALTFVFFGLANSWWMLFLARIAGGILSCAAMPTALAYIADSTSIEERGASMGLIGASIGMGMIFGPVIGGILSKISMAFPFYFAGLFTLINGLAIFAFLEESLPESKRNKMVKVKRASLLNGLFTPLAFILIIMLFTSISESIHHGTFALFIQGKLGFGPYHVGWAFSSAGLVAVIMQGLVVGKLINRYGEEKTAIGGLIVMVVGFILLLNSFSLVSVIIFMGIFASGIGLIRPSINSLVSKQTTKQQGATMGVLQAYDSLGRAIGPACGGFLLDINLSYAYITAIIAATIALSLFIHHHTRNVGLTAECQEN
ncbi:MAG TPA: MFS transporter [Syntrophomonadaceae bacterium]|nr:MFS transporter [Syntrophomonadaceae bacterium]